MSLTRGQKSLIWVEPFVVCVLCSYCSFWGSESRTQYHLAMILSGIQIIWAAAHPVEVAGVLYMEVPTMLSQFLNNITAYTRRQ